MEEVIGEASAGGDVAGRTVTTTELLADENTAAERTSGSCACEREEAKEPGRQKRARSALMLAAVNGTTLAVALCLASSAVTGPS